MKYTDVVRLLKQADLRYQGYVAKQQAKGKPMAGYATRADYAATNQGLGMSRTAPNNGTAKLPPADINRRNQITTALNDAPALPKGWARTVDAQGRAVYLDPQGRKTYNPPAVANMPTRAITAKPAARNTTAAKPQAVGTGAANRTTTTKRSVGVNTANTNMSTQTGRNPLNVSTGPASRIPLQKNTISTTINTGPASRIRR